jgi:hypothetical protein
MLDGGDVVARHDAIAHPVVLDRRRELSFEPVRVPRGGLRQLLRGLRPYGKGRDDVVMGVFELGWDLLLPQSLQV